MFLDNAKFYIKETISSSATTWWTFKISPKFKDNPNELEVLIDTWWLKASVELINGNSRERFTLTIVANTWYSTATIVKRWLKYDGSNTEVTELKSQWTDWTIGYITAFTADLNDKSDNQYVADWKKLYFWTDAYIDTVNDWTDLKFKDWNNAEVTLTELNAWAGTDHKVLNSSLDTTAWYLDSKLTVSWNWITKTKVNPWADESTNINLEFASQSEAESWIDNTKLMTSLRVKQSNSIWTGADWAIWAWNLTITGSNNTYILKKYTSFAPWANTITITPTGCILHIKVQWNCDLTWTTFNFAWKWWAGWAGWIAWAWAGWDWTAWLINQYWISTLWTWKWWVTSGWAWTGGWAGWITLLNSLIPWNSIVKWWMKIVSVWSGWGGWAGWQQSPSWAWAWWAGWIWWWCLILEVWWNLTFSSTTMTFTWNNWADWVSWTSWGGGGWWGWGGGWSVIILYTWTLSGTTTPSVLWGNWWTWATWATWLNWAGWGWGASVNTTWVIWQHVSWITSVWSNWWAWANWIYIIDKLS